MYCLAVCVCVCVYTYIATMVHYLIIVNLNWFTNDAKLVIYNVN